MMISLTMVRYCPFSSFDLERDSNLGLQLVETLTGNLTVPSSEKDAPVRGRATAGGVAYFLTFGRTGFNKNA